MKNFLDGKLFVFTYKENKGNRMITGERRAKHHQNNSQFVNEMFN